MAQFEEFAFYRPYLENPEIAVCSLRERIGVFIETAEDYWWTINTVGGEALTPDEIMEPLLQKALPWLNTWSLLDHFVRNGKPGDGQLGIAVYSASGYRDEALTAPNALRNVATQRMPMPNKFF